MSARSLDRDDGNSADDVQIAAALAAPLSASDHTQTLRRRTKHKAADLATAVVGQAVTWSTRQQVITIGLVWFVCTLSSVGFPAIFKVLEEEMHMSPPQLAAAATAGAALQAVSAPVWGILADRLATRADGGRAPEIAWAMLTAACGILTITSAFIATAPFPAWLIAARAVSGIAAGSISPITQTLVSDLFPASQRARVFGHISAIAHLGSIFAMLACGGLAHRTVLGMSGWRMCFWGITITCMFVGGISLAQTMHQRRQSSMISSLRPVSAHVVRPGGWEVARTLMRSKSFLAVIFQGSFAVAALTGMAAFGVMWLEYLGFSDMEASTIFALAPVGGLIGSILAGYVSDYMARHYPNYGRIIVGQLGVLLRVPLAPLVFVALPNWVLGVHGDQLFDSSGSAWPVVCFGTAFLFAGLLQELSYVGTVKPILTEVVPSSSRGTAMGAVAGIDGVLSAFAGPPLVALVAMRMFHYEKTTATVGNMGAHTRLTNLRAITTSLLFLQVAFVTLEGLCISFLYCTYPKEREAMERAEGEGEDSSLLHGTVTTA